MTKFTSLCILPCLDVAASNLYYFGRCEYCFVIVRVLILKLEWADYAAVAVIVQEPISN